MAPALNRTARRFVGTVVVGGALAAAAVLWRVGPARPDLLPLLVFGGLTLLAPLLTLRHRGNLPTTAIFQLSTSFACPLLLLLADPALIIPVFWLYVLVDRFLNRRRWIHTLFNLGQLGLSAALAAECARLLDLRLTGTADLTLGRLLLGGLAIGFFAFANHLLTHSIVRFASRRPLLPLDWYSRTGLLSETLMAASALTQAALWVVRPEIFLLGAVPVVALQILITRLVEREGRLDRRETEIHSLQELGLELGEEAFRDRLGAAVLRIVEQALDCRGSLLAMPDPSTDAALRVEACRSFPQDTPATIAVGGMGELLGDPPEIRAFADASEVARAMPDLAFLPEGSVLLAPLGGPGERGLLVLGHDERRRPFDESDRRRLRTLVRFIDVALKNAALVAEQREMQSHLIQQEKLSALGMLVAGVAHELNNPLTAVLGYSELLGDDEPDPRRRRMLSRIATETKRAGKIVQNLLTFSRKHTPEHRRIDIQSVLRDVLDFRAYEQGVNNIDVIRDLAEKLPHVDVDPHQFQQVFLNLITNAEHAVTTAGRNCGRIVVRTRRDRDTVRIEIEDNGRGIRPEHLKHVFLPFFTTKEVGQGTGLGLSICYGIVQAHGGKIDVRSRPNEGATFTIELPVARGLQVVSDAPASLRVPAAAGGPEVGGAAPGRLLIVDDEESILRLVRDFLVPRGWIVETALEGGQALELVRERSFDVLLVDLRMPGMDGRAFYEELRRERPGLADRVLFVTGHGGAGTDAADWLAERAHLLPKPFNLRELSEAIAEVLSGGDADRRIPREHRN